jgi:hypothetical protein
MMPGAPRYPDFVCIGAQKAGTTWLWHNLGAHPAIWLAPDKELHYFDRLYVPGVREAAERRRRLADEIVASDDPERARAQSARIRRAMEPISDAWYGAFFADAPADAVCGEITPAYALLPAEGVGHLLRLSPGVRIVMVVRDPIERAWSQLRMQRRSRVQADGVPAPGHVPEHVLARSRYSVTLRTYRAQVAPERLWLGDFDDIARRPELFLRELCAFLEVGGRPAPGDAGTAVHEGGGEEMDPETYDRLRAALEPEYHELAGLLPDLARRWTARHYPSA